MATYEKARKDGEELKRGVLVTPRYMGKLPPKPLRQEVCETLLVIAVLGTLTALFMPFAIEMLKLISEIFSGTIDLVNLISNPMRNFTSFLWDAMGPWLGSLF